MRVLIACPSYPPQDVTCGVGDYTRCLAEELARQGEQVTVVASAAWRGPADGGVSVLPILDEPAPWWRVVAANGRLVPGHEIEQSRRLKREGVAVVNGRVRFGRARAAGYRRGSRMRPPPRPSPNRCPGTCFSIPSPFADWSPRTGLSWRR